MTAESWDCWQWGRPSKNRSGGHISYISMGWRRTYQSGFGARTRENSRYLKQKGIQYSKLDICKICRRCKEFNLSELSTKWHRTENRTTVPEATHWSFAGNKKLTLTPLPPLVLTAENPCNSHCLVLEELSISMNLPAAPSKTFRKMDSAHSCLPNFSQLHPSRILALKESEECAC